MLVIHACCSIAHGLSLLQSLTVTYLRVHTLFCSSLSEMGLQNSVKVRIAFSFIMRSLHSAIQNEVGFSECPTEEERKILLPIIYYLSFSSQVSKANIVKCRPVDYSQNKANIKPLIHLNIFRSHVLAVLNLAPSLWSTFPIILIFAG